MLLPKTILNRVKETKVATRESMGKSRRISSGSLFLIEELAKKRLSAGEIRRELERRGLDPVSLPTIRDVAREATPADDSSPWRLEAAEIIDSRLVLEVLGSVLAETDGQVTHLTRREAQWVTALRNAQPSLTSDYGRIDTTNYWVIYQLANEYIQRRQREESTVDLDTFLAWAPWRDFHVCFSYNLGILEGQLQAPPVWLAFWGMPSSQGKEELPGDDLSDTGYANYANHSLSFVPFRGAWGGLSVIDFEVVGVSDDTLLSLDRGFTAFASDVIDLRDAAAQREYKRRAIADYYGSHLGDKNAFLEQLRSGDEVSARATPHQGS